MNTATITTFTRPTQQATAQISGLGVALPRFSISQIDACEFAQKSGFTGKYNRSLNVLYRQSGVERRYSVLLEKPDGPVMERQSFYPVVVPGRDRNAIDRITSVPSTARRMEVYKKFAPELAELACRRALDSAQVSVAEISHLITVSCTGFCAPGVDIGLIDSLGLRHDVQRTNVGFMGCHGSLNGMRVARAISESQPNACVLMVSVELCSLHQQYTDDPQQLVAGSLFSDGSAAIVVRSSHHQNDLDLMDDGAGDSRPFVPISIVSNASTILQQTQSMMSWQVGDFGFEMGLSPQVPEIVQQQLKAWATEWLAGQGLLIEDIVGWIVHPGGPRILNATATALDLTDAAIANSRLVLREYGNMSSATVLFILDLIQKQKISGPVVMLGFGPGLCIEACLLNI